MVELKWRVMKFTVEDFDLIWGYRERYDFGRFFNVGFQFWGVKGWIGCSSGFWELFLMWVLAFRCEFLWGWWV